jgi:hypothetical protein
MQRRLSNGAQTVVEWPMSTKHDSADLPPVVAAAYRRRRVKGRNAKKPHNNFIAENGLNTGPHLGNRKGAGARPGNRNAGDGAAWRRIRRARRVVVKAMLLDADQLIRELRALVPRAGGAEKNP